MIHIRDKTLTASQTLTAVNIKINKNIKVLVYIPKTDSTFPVYELPLVGV